MPRYGVYLALGAKGGFVEYVKVVAYAFIAIQVITACILLWLQLAAFRRYKHTSFRLLAVSTIGALLCLGLLFAPSFIATSPSARLNIFFLSSPSISATQYSQSRAQSPCSVLMVREIVLQRPIHVRSAACT